MTDAILALNAGSSSVKYALFETAPWRCVARDAREVHDDHEVLFGDILAWVDAHLGGDRLSAVGHRVVHGGRDFAQPVRLTPDIVARLAALTPLAPLHQPFCLSPVRAIAALRPNLPQVACFDTAFHRTMPDVAAMLALPRRYWDDGVRRYGFHGLSYEYISRQLTAMHPDLAKGRVIVAHLGNGASLCAMRNGVSIETSMGFTALDGLVMGTRCGTLDAGVVLYMLQHAGLGADAIENVLYRQSGLLGVSGISGDMRALSASDDPHARQAVDLFVYRVACQAAAFAGALGGLDGFVFTAGIGEHAAPVRDAIREKLRWLGDQVAFHVIPTDEEAMIARHTMELLGTE